MFPWFIPKIVTPPIVFESLEEAQAYLLSKGYTLTKKWTWIKPKRDHVMTRDEGNAIDYLADEWDYGGCER